MTVFRTFLGAGAAFVMSAGAALAVDWDENIDMCMEAADDEGLINVAEYVANFDGGSSRRFTIELEPVNGGDVIYAECRLARGRVVSVALDSQGETFARLIAQGANYP